MSKEKRTVTEWEFEDDLHGGRDEGAASLVVPSRPAPVKQPASSKGGSKGGGSKSSGSKSRAAPKSAPKGKGKQAPRQPEAPRPIRSADIIAVGLVVFLSLVAAVGHTRSVAGKTSQVAPGIHALA